MSDKWKVLVVMLVAIVLAAIGEALASRGMKNTQHGAMPLPQQLKAAISDWHVWAGTLLMVGYVLLYVYALGLTELSFALPLSAASYLLGALLAKFYLHEEIKPGRWVGTAIIILGVLVVAFLGQNSSSGSQ